MADPIDDQTVPTEEMAKELSKILGCTGAHKIEDGKWGPCPSRKHLNYLIKNGSPAYREWVAARRKAGKKMFVVASKSSPGINWIMKLITTNAIPIKGNNPFRFAKYSDK